MALETKVHSLAGLLPVSMVEWEGKLASVLFLRGCNLRCPYCHNPELVRADVTSEMAWDFVKEQLLEKAGWVDGVVITGGEPTICPDLREIISRIRDIGFAIKLDTNGTHPEVLGKLLKEGLLDCVAIDIKARFDGYDRVTRVQGVADAVKASVEIIVSSGIDHEFRTTVAPGFVEPVDLVEIAQYLGGLGARRFFLQQFIPDNALEAELRSVQPFSLTALERSVEACVEFIPTKLRGAV